MPAPYRYVMDLPGPGNPFTATEFSGWIQPGDQQIPAGGYMLYTEEPTDTTAASDSEPLL